MIVLPDTGAVFNDVPYATHTGVLVIGPCRIDCARLSNGKAVITEDGLRQFLEWMGMGVKP